MQKYFMNFHVFILKVSHGFILILGENFYK